MPSFPTLPSELLLEIGLCYRAPGRFAAGARGRQEQAPSATDSSSTLAESARERPELGMTPPSKVPYGFIYRPQLQFPSPLNFPALLFFWTCFSSQTNTFSTEVSSLAPCPFPASPPPSTSRNSSSPHWQPPPVWSQPVNSAYS